MQRQISMAIPDAREAAAGSACVAYAIVKPRKVFVCLVGSGVQGKEREFWRFGGKGMWSNPCVSTGFEMSPKPVDNRDENTKLLD